VYCGQGHQSASCDTIADVTARREVLRKAGRCYICLRKNHLSRDCHSSFSCRKCRGRHHTSICSRHNQSETHLLHRDQVRDPPGRPPQAPVALRDLLPVPSTQVHKPQYCFRPHGCSCVTQIPGHPYLQPEPSWTGQWESADLHHSSPPRRTQTAYCEERIFAYQDFWVFRKL